MFAGKKSAQIREILISESAWEEMTCLFAPSLTFIDLNANFSHAYIFNRNHKVFSHYRTTSSPCNNLIFKEKTSKPH
ncbi:hypothetical protein AXT31_13900 [Salmonella enterica subsp. enterica serovar Heidelberg]|nr:hypothetical protein [Salmonella enterica subsp. enterica serovar Heidelberg]